MLRAKLIYEIKCLYCKVLIHIPLIKYVERRPYEITCPHCGKKMAFMIECGRADLESWAKTYEATMQTVLVKSLRGQKIRLILKKQSAPELT